MDNLSWCYALMVELKHFDLSVWFYPNANCAVYMRDQYMVKEHCVLFKLYVNCERKRALNWIKQTR